MPSESNFDGALDRYDERPSVDTELNDATGFVRDRIDENLPAFADRFPAASSDDLTYEPTDNEGWTTSFWTGMLWLAYEETGETTYRKTAIEQLSSFGDRLAEGRDVDTHDLGFLYTLSSVAAHRVLGSDDGRGQAIEAATRLADRYWSAPGIVQAWGPVPGEPDEWYRGRVIVDTMMNLPLLYWAGEETGDPRYREIATTHARRTARTLVRDDASTFHTYVFDTETGEPVVGETHQGYADDSCWARGQAWTLYGLALAYGYTGEDLFYETAVDVADYYLASLPNDHVPRWDFDAPDDDPRDSSAGAIAACGLLELAEHAPAATARGARYANAALATLDSLSRNYTTEGRESNGVLAEAAYNKPEGDYDECCIWGDYFYYEGLLRATTRWTPYW